MRIDATYIFNKRVQSYYDVSTGTLHGIPLPYDYEHIHSEREE